MALDFETTGLRWRDGDKPLGVAVAWREGEKVESRYLPFGHNGGNLAEDVVRRWFRTELRGKRLVGANTKFDAHMAHAWGEDLEDLSCTLGDVQHYAALLDDHRRKFNLEQVSQDFLGRGKVKGVDPSKMRYYHAGEVADYARRDATLVIELLDAMNPQLEAQDLRHVCDLEDELIFAVCEMERNAAPLDITKLRRWNLESEQSLIRALWQIHELSGVSVSPESNDDLVRLFRSRDLPLTHFTETGKFSFTDEVLASVEDEAVAQVRRARKLSSLRSKYLVPYLAEVLPDGRLTYNLHQLRTDEGGTISGRFSASDRNIQQVMAVEKQRAAFGDRFIVRELFVPASGLFYKADAAQIEYRIFAHYLNDEKVLEEYRKNPRASFHKLIHEFIAQFNPSILYKVVKNTNFCKIYGGGVRKIALTAGITEDAAFKLNALYRQIIPGVDALLERASHAAETRGYVKTLLGRRTRFPQRERLHKALNGVIQGGAADIMKRKLVELHHARKNTGFVMRMTVHDEVCGDVPDIEAAARVTEILNRQSFDLRVPILWDAKTGANWAEAE